MERVRGKEHREVTPNSGSETIEQSSQNPDRSDEPDRLQTIATMAMPRIEAMASDWLANRETVRFFSRSRREKGRHSPRRIAIKPCGVKRRLNND